MPSKKTKKTSKKVKETDWKLKSVSKDGSVKTYEKNGMRATEYQDEYGFTHFKIEPAFTFDVMDMMPSIELDIPYIDLDAYFSYIKES